MGGLRCHARLRVAGIRRSLHLVVGADGELYHAARARLDQRVFMVNLGSPLEIVDARCELHRIDAGEGFAGGLARASSLSRSTGAMTGVHLHLPASTLARLLGLPLAELCDRVVPLDQLLGSDATVMGEWLLAETAHEERWAIMDTFVEQRMGASGPRDTEVEQVRSRLARGEPVTTIADDVGCSRKRLAQRFRDNTGLLPRDMPASPALNVLRSHWRQTRACR